MNTHDSIALTGGEWRPDHGGILRWHPGPVTLHSVDTGPEIACHRCGALVTESCRAKSGRRTQDHAERFLERRCECGGQVGPRRSKCEECVEARRIATKRAWHQRQKVAA